VLGVDGGAYQFGGTQFGWIGLARDCQQVVRACFGNLPQINARHYCTGISIRHVDGPDSGPGADVENVMWFVKRCFVECTV
jgi:hypothetical protein